MEAIVEDVVDSDDLKKYELIYYEQLKTGPHTVSAKAQFDYAWCLVRSKRQADVKQGNSLLQDLFTKSSDDGEKRDYLFYMAVGNTRLKEYDIALKYVDAILALEPGNHQVRALREHIEKKLKRDGLLGMAAVGGAVAVGIGAVVAAGLALSKK